MSKQVMSQVQFSDKMDLAFLVLGSAGRVRPSRAAQQEEHKFYHSQHKGY